MAEFCNKCTEELFGEDATPDIDVYGIFRDLEPMYYRTGFICEGCGLTAIEKTDDSELKVMIDNEWVDY